MESAASGVSSSSNYQGGTARASNGGPAFSSGRKESSENDRSRCNRPCTNQVGVGDAAVSSSVLISAFLVASCRYLGS